jgi:hypothetical protein
MTTEQRIPAQPRTASSHTVSAQDQMYPGHVRLETPLAACVDQHLDTRVASRALSPVTVFTTTVPNGQGQLMNSHFSRSQRVPETFAADARPGADTCVYCKGCGISLTGQARRQQARTAIITMMCTDCQETHGHTLMPAQDSPSFCYRCGGPDVTVIEDGYSPVTHHLCPRCVPDKVARYRAGDFETQYQDRVFTRQAKPV